MLRSPALRLGRAAWVGALATIVLARPATSQQDSPRAASAAERSPAALPFIGEGFVLDGPSDEAAWASVPPLPLVTYEPAYRQQPSQRTEIRVAYDQTHLYVAGRLYESSLDEIRRASLYRDRWSGDDRLGVLIDPFDDNETGLWFWTTPNGVRGDALITGDGAGISSDWNTHWEVAVEETAEGWFAELRIPFSSLGFQASGGRVTMGLIVHRDLTSRNERHLFPDVSPDFSWQRPSLARDVELSAVRSDRPVYVSPYALTGRRREARLQGTPASFGFVSEIPSEVGVDVRYPIRPNLTVDLTANTDFAQVEVDNQQVNLTRFGLFFPEKRQFFLERAGIFSFTTGGADRLFHSRRIGLDDGEPVRILGGVRLAGRMGEWDVGMLDLQTEETSRLASTNHGVVRLRRRVLNDYSTAGAMVTSRLGSDGGYNVAYGLDGRVRWRGDHYVAAQWAHTLDETDGVPDGPTGEPDGGTGAPRSGVVAGGLNSSLARIRVWNQVQQGFQYFLAGRWIGPTYRPEMGFLLRSDISEVNYSFAWSRILGEDRSIRRIDPFQLFGNVVLRNGDRSVESAQIEYDTDVTWKSGWGLWQDFELYYDDLRAPLSFGDGATVPVGRYWYFRTEGGLNVPPGSRLRAPVNWGLQRFYDGSRWNIGVFPTWNASPHLTLRGQYRLDVVRFPSRGQGFDSHLVQLRIETALDTHLSLSAFLQYSSLADVASANLRMRYAFAEGRDLWVVYDEGLLTERDHLDPRPPLSMRRTLLIKYGHTLTW